MTHTDEAQGNLWEAQRRCISALKELVKATSWQDGRKRIAEVLAEYRGWPGAEGIKDADQFIQNSLDALKALEDAQEAMNLAIMERQQVQE